MLLTQQQKLKEIINKNPSGFTIYNHSNFIQLKKGYSVALTNNKEKDINLLIEKAVNLYGLLKKLCRYKLYFGGWKDNDNNFYLDISIIIKDDDKRKFAFDVAKLQQQKSIFNFKTLNCEDCVYSNEI